MLSMEQALNIAIESINMREDISQRKRTEAIKILQKASKRIQFKEWDKDSIIKALMDYKERTGKTPTVTNLVEFGMPKSLTIQTHFNMKASKLLNQLFPEERTQLKKKSVQNIYGFVTEEHWLNCFAVQFNKHINLGLTSKTYNMLKDKGTPQWETIARHCNTTKWGELMKKANVKYPNQKDTTEFLFVSDAQSPLITKLETLNTEREKMNSDFREMLNSYEKLISQDKSKP